MPLEIKGLKANMTRLKATVDELNALAMRADGRGTVLKSHLTDVGDQLANHVSDLEFAASTLGNSPNDSDEEEEKPQAKEEPRQPEPPKTEAAKIAPSPFQLSEVRRDAV